MLLIRLFDYNTSDLDFRFHIQLFGITRDRKSVCLTVDDFKPHFYIKLSETQNETIFMDELKNNYSHCIRHPSSMRLSAVKLWMDSTMVNSTDSFLLSSKVWVCFEKQWLFGIRVIQKAKIFWTNLVTKAHFYMKQIFHPFYDFSI